MVICIVILTVATYKHFGEKVKIRYEKAEFSSLLTLPEFPHSSSTPNEDKKPLVLDIDAYNRKVYEISNNPISYASSTLKEYSSTTAKYLWPVKTVYPNAGALLPFNRIVAYYGNLYSKQMGVLGQYPEDEMLAKLNVEVKKWQEADPNTPVIPALHYIAVTAQASGGFDGKYRARMPDHQIDKVIEMSKKINAIVFIDIQVGLSDIRDELPMFEKYLKMPNVHLGVDPEFYMRNGKRPGTVIGTMDAKDINYTTQYLARLVKENQLPPKILVVHRFTEGMVTNYKQINTLPETQIVMDMDGWGPKANKLDTYDAYIYKQPVQFTGFKLFYKNDTLTGTSSILTPKELVKLRPQPMYIQYQ
jgi:hypothetical protein